MFKQNDPVREAMRVKALREIDLEGYKEYLKIGEPGLNRPDNILLGLLYLERMNCHAVDIKDRIDSRTWLVDHDMCKPPYSLTAQEICVEHLVHTDKNPIDCMKWGSSRGNDLVCLFNDEHTLTRYFLLYSRQLGELLDPKKTDLKQHILFTTGGHFIRLIVGSEAGDSLKIYEHTPGILYRSVA